MNKPMLALVLGIFLISPFSFGEDINRIKRRRDFFNSTSTKLLQAMNDSTFGTQKSASIEVIFSYKDSNDDTKKSSLQSASNQITSTEDFRKISAILDDPTNCIKTQIDNLIDVMNYKGEHGKLLSDSVARRNQTTIHKNQGLDFHKIVVTLERDSSNLLVGHIELVGKGGSRIHLLGGSRDNPSNLCYRSLNDLAKQMSFEYLYSEEDLEGAFPSLNSAKINMRKGEVNNNFEVDTVVNGDRTSQAVP